MGVSEFQIFFSSTRLLLLCEFVGDVWEPVTQEHQARWGVDLSEQWAAVSEPQAMAQLKCPLTEVIMVFLDVMLGGV